MSGKTNRVSTKQLVVILTLVAILLGVPLGGISLWSISAFERIDQKLERIDQKIEQVDSKINKMAIEFAEVKGILKAKGIATKDTSNAIVTLGSSHSKTDSASVEKEDTLASPQE